MNSFVIEYLLYNFFNSRSCAIIFNYLLKFLKDFSIFVKGRLPLNGITEPGTKSNTILHFDELFTQKYKQTIDLPILFSKEEEPSIGKL